MHAIIILRSYARFLKIIRFGLHTPRMDIWNDKGVLVPVDAPEYRSLVYAHIQTGLYNYYLQITKLWKIWRIGCPYPRAVAVDKNKSQQPEFDF